MTYAEYERLRAEWERKDREYYSGADNTPPGPPPVPPVGYHEWVQAGKPAGNWSSSNPWTQPGIPEGTPASPADSDFDAVNQVLAENPWLQELPGIYEMVTQLVIDNTPSTSIAAEIRKTDVWKKRFSGIVALQNAGRPVISEAEYLGVENQYFTMLSEARIMPYLGLNTAEEFQAWAGERIGGSVSPLELSRRIDAGVALAEDTDRMVRDAFIEFYGVAPTKEALLLWALEPEAGVNEIERQLAAAEVGGEAFRFGLNITRTRAELLRSRGVTADLARRGFADVAREDDQLRRLARIHNFNPLAQEELEDFFFHEDPEVGKRRAETFQRALAEFQGGSPTSPNRGGGLQSLVDARRTV